ncbi:MAG: MBL fold metallo-hydrolase [Subdoligranulum sp.]|nr:MBL fold metallo-hydrolase [Subdoligranulum sp.]
MAASTNRNKRNGKQEKQKAALKKLLSMGAALLVLLVAVASLTVQNGGTLPTWEQLYAWFGVSELAPQLPEQAQNAATKIHFIDVGQGDAVLIEQDGCFALIDAGDRDAEDALISYLQSVGVEKLSLLVMTHPHADHIGSMRAVIETFPVETILLPDFTKAPMPTTATFTKLLEAVRTNGIKALTARTGDVFTLGSGTLTVLGDGVNTDNLNDLSLVTMFEASGIRYFSSGDGEKAVERALLDSGANVSANLYKAAHHGSSTSNSQELLEAVHPRVVVISCGKDNSYGHPHKEALEAYEAVHANVFRTDECGTVIAYVDESGLLQIAVTNREAA